MPEGLDPRERAYATMVASVDDALGTLLEVLDRAGARQDTLVIFTSDNGGLSAHGRGGEAHTHNRPLASGKGSALEGGVRAFGEPSRPIFAWVLTNSLSACSSRFRSSRGRTMRMA
jgi:hypothetical protein